jgi:hypothetical protein
VYSTGFANIRIQSAGYMSANETMEVTIAIREISIFLNFMFVRCGQELLFHPTQG